MFDETTIHNVAQTMKLEDDNILVTQSSDIFISLASMIGNILYDVLW